MRDRCSLLALILAASLITGLPLLASVHGQAASLAINVTATISTSSTSTGSPPPPLDQNSVIIYSVGVLALIIGLSAVAWLTRPRR